MTASPTSRRETIRTALRWLLTASMVWIGVMHFVDPDTFVGIMPPWLPWHLELVWLSGVFEILGGLGLISARTRNMAGWGLIALFLAVFPANLHMAFNDVPFQGEPVPTVLLWGRLPFQLVFIVWAWWVSRPAAD